MYFIVLYYIGLDNCDKLVQCVLRYTLYIYIYIYTHTDDIYIYIEGERDRVCMLANFRIYGIEQTDQGSVSPLEGICVCIYVLMHECR